MVSLKILSFFVPNILLDLTPMNPKETNVAYIDGANLHVGIRALGWKLDYARFRVWLREKFFVDKAYLFIGLITKNAVLYQKLQEAGFVLVFKETVCVPEGKVKGNCDADLVLKAVSDFYEKKYHQAVIVSGDGDFASLVSFLKERNAFRELVAIDNKKCSILLKRTNVRIVYLKELKERLKLKEKAPDADGTA